MKRSGSFIVFSFAFSEQLSSRESRKVSRRCRARACVGAQPLTPLDRRRRIFIPNINWQIAVASAETEVQFPATQRHYAQQEKKNRDKRIGTDRERMWSYIMPRREIR
jgi:hypothetical protein